MRKKEKKEKKLNREELIGFCSQMAAILHSGISSFEGISLMMEEQENPAGRAALEEIYQEMMAGGSLGDGIEKSGLFPEYACRMIRLGETSGRTDEVMNHLARSFLPAVHVDYDAGGAVCTYRKGNADFSVCIRVAGNRHAGHCRGDPRDRNGAEPLFCGNCGSICRAVCRHLVDGKN